MKKLLIVLVLSVVSFSSMAMGFPHSTFAQQRELISKSKKMDFVQNVKQTNVVQLEEKIADKVAEENTTLVESLVQHLGNFLVRIFTNSFSSHKSLVMNETKIKLLPCPKNLAIPAEKIIFIG